MLGPSLNLFQDDKVGPESEYERVGFVVVRVAVKHVAASVSPSVLELRQTGARGFVACHDVDDGGEQTAGGKEH